MQGMWVSSMIVELRSHSVEQLSPCAKITESVCCNERSCMTQRRPCVPQLRPNAAK